MKLNNFTIFIILLIVIFALMIIFRLASFKETKESLVNFQSANTSNSMIYIPQYSTDSSRTVIHLYDNIYFDHKNGALIEVNSVNTPPANDVSGSSIVNISIVPRNGASITTYPSPPIGADGSVPPFATSESLVSNLNPTYNEFSYRTQCMTTDKYQIFYYAWNKDTYIHLVKNAGVNPQPAGTNIATYRLTPDGLANTFTFGSAASNAALPTFLPANQSPPNISDANNGKMVSLPSYLNGLQVYQITSSVYYDIANGNIVTKDSSGNVITYNRDGPGISITPKNVGKITPTAGTTNAITVSDNKGGMVLIITYKSMTMISVLLPRQNDKSYIIGASVRFNGTQAVVDTNSDSDNYPKATSAPGTGVAGVGGAGDRYPDNWQQMYANKGMAQMSAICGDDLSCKWYWYFKNMSGYNDGITNTYSDDYILKTEAVPPVCPKCPNCPSTGTCTTCGGNGGCGTTGVSLNGASVPTGTKGATGTVSSGSGSVTLNLTPIGGATTYKDASGNVYLSQTDASGNTKYIIQSKDVSGSTVAGAKSYTTVDNNGKLVTIPVDPNRIGGVVSNAVDKTTGLAGSVFDKAGNLISGGGSGAANLLKSTGSGTVDLLKSTGSGTVNFLKDIGSGIKSLGTGALTTQQGQQVQQGQQGQQGQVVASGQVGAPSGALGFSQVSDRSYGNMGGQTPVDNYSYYGALQSKGGDFMPVTSDFSSFRK